MRNTNSNAVPYPNSAYFEAFSNFLIAQGSPQNTRATYLNFVRHLGDFLEVQEIVHGKLWLKSFWKCFFADQLAQVCDAGLVRGGGELLPRGV